MTFKFPSGTPAAGRVGQTHFSLRLPPSAAKPRDFIHRTNTGGEQADQGGPWGTRNTQCQGSVFSLPHGPQPRNTAGDRPPKLQERCSLQPRGQEGQPRETGNFSTTALLQTDTPPRTAKAPRLCPHLSPQRGYRHCLPTPIHDGPWLKCKMQTVNP